MDNYNKLWATIRNTDLLNNDEKNELQLYLFNLNEQVKKQKEIIDKTRKTFEECKMLLPHEFDWEEQINNVLNTLKEV